MLQSLGLAEMNREGSTQALPRPSRPVLREKDREKPSVWDTFQHGPCASGPIAKVENFPTYFFS